MKTIIFKAERRAKRKQCNFSHWTLTLYWVKNNKPEHFETIKTEYSSHEKNILEYLQSRFHPRSKYEQMRKHYRIYEI